MTFPRPLFVVLCAAVACGTAADTTPKPSPDDALRAEILARAARDQSQMRALATSPNDSLAQRAMRSTLRDNVRWLDSIVVARGHWPGLTEVDSSGANAAFLLAQHGDSVPEAQARLLDALRQAVTAKEASGSQLAFLEDRVRKAQGKPQLYGTQVAYDTAANPVQPLVEAPDSLDIRRASVGLPPMADYLKHMRDVNAQLRAMSPPKARP
ncbi:MAG: hypothetical protein IT353_06625 [Gemmatimonadaceae bacterium]|nr:hypothetical protein [Gemmatimonadaceae bacterium]